MMNLMPAKKVDHPHQLVAIGNASTGHVPAGADTVPVDAIAVPAVMPTAGRG